MARVSFDTLSCKDHLRSLTSLQVELFGLPGLKYSAGLPAEEIVYLDEIT
jgi:hypothetical protein